MWNGKNIKFKSHLELLISSAVCLQGYLLYRDTTNHSTSALKINPETLEHEGTVAMPGD